MTSLRSSKAPTLNITRRKMTSLSDCLGGILCKALLAAGLLFYMLYVFLSSNNPAIQPHNFLSYLGSKRCSASPSSSSSNPDKTDISHIVLGIAGSAKTWKNRGPYVDLWWRPNKTRGFVWLDQAPSFPWPASSPPYRISEDTSRFRDYAKHAMPFAIRMVRVIIESFRAETQGMRWLVMADDDTVLFLDNLVEVLNKYDHESYFYIGGSSECISQNFDHSFDMAFGGAAYAMSFPLAKALVRILDDCLKRYQTLYGSDHVIQSCVAEIGVPLTREPGFHQIDLHGDISGLLSAHPQAPLLSFHHIDFVDPIFPSMTRLQSLEHLFKAADADSSRLLQQTVCYDKQTNWSLSISWGYSAQIYEKILPPSVLQRPIQTFQAWKNTVRPPFMFNTRPLSNDPCEAPHWFFFESRESGSDMIVTKYVRRSPRGMHNCTAFGNHSANGVSEIQVLSPRKRLMRVGRRRECCEVSPSSGRERLRVKIRACLENVVVA